MTIFNTAMAKRVCLLAMVLSFCNVYAQERAAIITRLNAIESTTDANNRRNALLAIAEQIKKQDLSAIDTISKTCNILNLIHSDDGKLSIVAFGAPTYKGIFQLQWLVYHNNAVWSFTDEISYNDNKEVPKLHYELIQSLSGLYSFKVINKKQTLINAYDLETQCLFEHLQHLSSNAEKDSVNDILQNRLLVLWADSELYDEEFEHFKRMKTLRSDDGKVKICTYNIQKEDFKQQFYGAVIVNENGIKVNLLNDASAKIRSPERSSLTNKKWYGALYIDMIENVSGNKVYYTLLGYRGHDEFMKTRVIDVLIVQNGRLRFGSPIFKTERITRNRMVYQYAAGATMMMRYDAKQKMIVFDNLAPTQPMFRGVYQYYGPDFSYNAFKFSKGVWQLKKEVDLRNPKK